MKQLDLPTIVYYRRTLLSLVESTFVAPFVAWSRRFPKLTASADEGYSLPLSCDLGSIVYPNSGTSAMISSVVSQHERQFADVVACLLGQTAV
jgi:hypothetical protein